MLTVKKSDMRADYAPPILGNGDIAVYSDINGQDSYIWWAGHRYMDSFARKLIPFGKVTQTVGDHIALSDWQQSLDTDNANIKSVSLYGDFRIDSTEFVHAEHNLLAIKKRFTSDTPVRYSFTYVLTGPTLDGQAPRRFSYNAAVGANSMDIAYSADGQQQYNGHIRLFCTGMDLRASAEGNVFALSGEVSNGEVCIYMQFIDGEDSFSVKSFDDEQTSHEKRWHDYNAEGYVKVSDKAVTDTYATALYHLKCYTTKWSIPVGLNNSHWESKFFAFDEYFSYIGLLTGNHVSLAKRVPEFRYAGLASAIFRASSKNVNEARYPWETVETGEEASSYGFWYEHIFHMSHITIGAWEYYLYTGDRAFLEGKSYPMMKACCEFFLRHMVYRDYGRPGRTVIGKCTDLERLGSSVENAFMTTCSVIASLRYCAEATELLGADADFAHECRTIAAELKANLPDDGEKYVPYPGCQQKSIAVMSGTYYNVLPPDDLKQRKALEDYCNHELEYGNMYALGHGVSSWYALWKAITYTRWRESGKAYEAVKQALESVGGFSEMFEINEPNHRMRPWFTTASGIYIHTINEMLLQSDGDTVYIAPSVPAEWTDYAFKLRAKNDVVVEVEVKDGKVLKLNVEKGANCPYEKIHIVQ